MRAHIGVLRKLAKIVSHVAEERLATQDATAMSARAALTVVVRCDTKALADLNRLDYEAVVMAGQFEKSV
ncbi:MAG: hypothetical protein AB7P20_14945 [Rhizobiaceae bacterium]